MSGFCRIAHISDVHTLDAERHRSNARYRAATALVGLGRPADPRLRARKLTRALAAAKASGADHVVITGDLTEIGEAAEFAHFAHVLDEARMPIDSVTLVPGNHDAYTSGSAWRRALEGPLARYAAASAAAPGKLVERGDLALLPIDTSCFQSIGRSGGLFSPEAARAVQARIDDAALRDKAVVLVMHHPPFLRHKSALVEWIDGLRGCRHVLDMLSRHPRLQIVHGHTHRVADRIAQLGKGFVGIANRARVFGAPAIVDDEDDVPRVRLYDVRDGMLEAAGLFAM